MQPNERTIVALDVDSLDKVARLVEDLSPHVGGFKIGMRLAARVGAPQAVGFVHTHGGKVFLDEKYKDTLNTVAEVSAAVADLGVMMFSLHADGGSEMMKAAMKAVEKRKTRPLVLGVTVLTSIDAPALKEIGYPDKIAVKPSLLVTRLALLALNSGLDGVIASAQEAESIRNFLCDTAFTIVTPAVRPEWALEWAPADDQKRPTTHIEAVEAGADYIVVGRPILKAPNQVDAAKRIADELA